MRIQRPIPAIYRSRVPAQPPISKSTFIRRSGGGERLSVSRHAQQVLERYSLYVPPEGVSFLEEKRDAVMALERASRAIEAYESAISHDVPWRIVGCKTTLCALRAGVQGLRDLPEGDHRRGEYPAFDFYHGGEFRNRFDRIATAQNFAQSFIDRANEAFRAVGHAGFPFTNRFAPKSPDLHTQEITALQRVYDSLTLVTADSITNETLDALLETFSAIPFWWTVQAWQKFKQIRMEYVGSAMAQLGEKKKPLNPIAMGSVDLESAILEVFELEFLFWLVVNPTAVTEALQREEADYPFNEVHIPDDVKRELRERSSNYREKKERQEQLQRSVHAHPKISAFQAALEKFMRGRSVMPLKIAFDTGLAEVRALLAQETFNPFEI